MVRIDLHVEFTPVPFKDISANGEEESSENIQKGVIKVRNAQLERFKDSPIHSNAQMSSKQVNMYCEIYEISQKTIE